MAQNTSQNGTKDQLIAGIQKTIVGKGSFMPFTDKLKRWAIEEPTNWLPIYWLAYCHSMETFAKKEIDEKDKLLSTADKYLNEADKLSQKNDEIKVLKGQIAAARIAASPSFRWLNYGFSFRKAVKNAEALNADNPRIAYLRGVNLFYTPKFWGGGKKTASSELEKASKKFKKFIPKSSVHPNWGKMETEYFIWQCKQ